MVVLDALADEGTGTASFDVTLTSPDTDSVSVNFATADGTALAGSDYTATIGIATFLPGDTVERVSVPVLDDGIAEEEQLFALFLANAVGGTIGWAQAIGTIVDDDTEPALSIADTSVPEGDAGSSVATITVSLSTASESTVSVGYATADAGATSGVEYTPVSGTLTFLPAAVEETIDVSLLADTTYEGDEGIAVDLAAPLNATLLDASGLLTIADDDPATALSIDDVTASEGDAGSFVVTFTITKASPRRLGGRSSESERTRWVLELGH